MKMGTVRTKSSLCGLDDMKLAIMGEYISLCIIVEVLLSKRLKSWQVNAFDARHYIEVEMRLTRMKLTYKTVMGYRFNDTFDLLYVFARLNENKFICWNGTS